MYSHAPTDLSIVNLTIVLWLCIEITPIKHTVKYNAECNWGRWLILEYLLNNTGGQCVLKELESSLMTLRQMIYKSGNRLKFLSCNMSVCNTCTCNSHVDMKKGNGWFKWKSSFPNNELKN